MRFWWVFLLFFLLPYVLPGQQRPWHYLQPELREGSFYRNDTILNQKRLRITAGFGVGAYAGLMTALGLAWYQNTERDRFKFFNDGHEWLQMDKAGHVLGTFHASRGMIDMMRWSGADKPTSLLVGGLYGFVTVSTVELFDAYGAKWGFSWWDVAANFGGAALAVGNQLAWNENRIQLKVSYLPSDYALEPDYADLFGNSFLENAVKDYNGQAIWLSLRLHSFLPDGGFKRIYPRWLNIAFGYSGEGMIGGYDDPSAAYKLREYRQFYLSLDIDLSNIPVKNGFFRSLLSIVNFVRIPLPSIRFDRNGVGVEAFR